MEIFNIKRHTKAVQECIKVKKIIQDYDET